LFTFNRSRIMAKKLPESLKKFQFKKGSASKPTKVAKKAPPKKGTTKVKKGR